jgi:hypothetical protein
MEFNIRSRFYNGSELQVTGVVRCMAIIIKAPVRKKYNCDGLAISCF